MSFDDLFLHFFDPAQEKAHITSIKAGNGNFSAAASSVGAETSQDHSSAAHEGSQSVHSVNGNGIDIISLASQNLNNAGNSFPEANSETSHARSAMEVISCTSRTMQFSNP